MKKNLILAGIFFSSCAFAQSQPPTTPWVGTGNTTSGQMTTAPVGSGCTNCVPMPITGSSSSPIPITPFAGASTDISGTVTAGGSYQTVAAASTTRHNCTIENPTTATEVLNVKFGTMAQPFTLAAGQTISALNGTVVATDAITVTATTTGHAFSGTCQ